MKNSALEQVQRFTERNKQAIILFTVRLKEKKIAAGNYQLLFGPQAVKGEVIQVWIVESLPQFRFLKICVIITAFIGRNFISAGVVQIPLIHFFCFLHKLMHN